mmetsp:Transcript_129735/g.276855  ORF Transcript_129735/g.276855 Transcript_129735/m.276855 type:complete len:156 (-) Transcript_129735:166-633(-)
MIFLHPFHGPPGRCENEIDQVLGPDCRCMLRKRGYELDPMPKLLDHLFFLARLTALLLLAQDLVLRIVLDVALRIALDMPPIILDVALHIFLKMPSASFWTLLSASFRVLLSSSFWMLLAALFWMLLSASFWFCCFDLHQLRQARTSCQSTAFCA